MIQNPAGAWGEIFAARYLRDQGYDIAAANYRSRFGEIDIVASDGRCLVFIEVKARSDGMIAAPGESVDLRKQKKISATAADFLSKHPTELYARFDVIEVYLDREHRLKKIEHIKSAFDAESGW
ncbi:MAG: YraN family protein [Oscillospiraceae bacterium]|nr:YraN family protein [Oscillospiraceae bacterium]